jgi:hypothetical protein
MHAEFPAHAILLHFIIIAVFWSTLLLHRNQAPWSVFFPLREKHRKLHAKLELSAVLGW